jgi:predicted PurR-regulated permease PerM
MNEPETKPAAAPVANDWGSRSHIRTLVLLVATAFGIYLCYRLAAPFVSAIVWAVALAVLFTPFQRWFESKLRHPSLAAVVSVLMISLGVLVIATFVGERLVTESVRGVEIIRAKVESGEWRRIVEAQPRLAPLADWIDAQLDLPGTVKALATWLTTTAGSILKGSVIRVIEFCLTIYLLFYFLRDRRAALLSLRSLSPLTEREMDRMLARTGDSISAIAYGTLAVSAMQGLLGGLMFWWLGLPAALVWGVVMALLAVVPVLGAFVVWIPAALFLALEGSWGKAVILALWGMLVVGTIDNLLRPVLVGNRLKLHTVLAFMSVVGGLMLFGTCGLILGPVILTITMELLGIRRSRAAGDAAARVDPGDLARLENEGGHAAPDADGRAA